jgi:hypothetical protein
MRVAVTLVAAFLVATAGAEPAPWMKKANANELVTLVVPGKDCPASVDEIQETVSGVLIRSRIKRVAQAPTRENAAGTFPWLMIAVRCTDDLFAFDIDFVEPDTEGFLDRLGLIGYGTSGTNADREDFLNSLRQDVERAITDYLKANFDL